MPYLIVGLGNPGKEYQDTRHNAGFLVLDALAKKWNVEIKRKKFKGFYAEYFPESGEKIYLLKPQTYMNLSGECVSSWVSFLKISNEKILVIHDELDLALGKLKAQWAAGPAGHNGIRSIIQSLGHQDFNRLRIGVGHPGRKEHVTDHVLSKFSSAEQKQWTQIITASVEATLLFIKKGLDPVCQMVNKRPII